MQLLHNAFCRSQISSHTTGVKSPAECQEENRLRGSD